MKFRLPAYFTAALLIILPFGVWGETVHFGHAHTLIIAVVIILALSLPNKYIRIFMMYVAAWLAYIAAGLFLGYLTAGAHLTLVLIDGAIWIILGGVALAVIYHGDIEQETVFNIICIAAIVQATIGTMQAFGYDPVFGFMSKLVAVKTELPRNAAVGTLGNNNFLAAFVAISLPFFFRQKKYEHFLRPRIYIPQSRHGSYLRFTFRWWCFLPLLIACLIVAKTTTALVAALAGCCFYFFPWLRNNLKITIPLGITLVAAVACYCTIWHPIFTNDRPELWLDGIQQVTRTWQTILIGYGPAAKWKIGDMLHSEYVIALYNFGIIGVAIVAGYIRSVFKNVQKVNRCVIAAFVVICVDAIGNHLLHTIPTALLVIAITAMIEKEEQI